MVKGLDDAASRAPARDATGGRRPTSGWARTLSGRAGCGRGRARPPAIPSESPTRELALTGHDPQEYGQNADARPQGSGFRLSIQKGAREMRRLLMLVTIGLLPLGLVAAPASATVHEIVGQWCSGQGDLFPPGISGGSNADNFARPLFASGFASIVDPFDPDGPGGADEGALVAFDFDHPASKIVSLGFFVQIDTLPDGRPLYLEAFELDTSHGFTNCARLSN